MKPTEDQIQVAQGALYLVDHIGSPPPGMQFRQFTEQAIAQHLEQHPYFYLDKKAKSRNPVTMPWMRRYLRELSVKAKASLDPPQSDRDDYADKLLRRGTTEGFPADLLSRFEYDRAAFSEADLSGYTPQAEESEDDEHTSEANINEDGKDLDPQRQNVLVGSSDLQDSGERRLRGVPARPLSPSRDSQASFKPTKEDANGVGYEEDEKEDGDEDGDESDRYSDAKDQIENLISEHELQPPLAPAAEAIEQNEPQIQSRADPGKRKYGDRNLGDSDEDELATKPSEPKKRKTSTEPVQRIEHPEVVIPGAASLTKVSSQLTLDKSTALEPDAAHGLGHTIDMQSGVVEVQDSQPSQRSPASQAVD